ncbi:hypothetical protein [Actinomadura rudentiformis]|uniref:Uncharacterized protein n=1 Tax=Actinomadura rudentiformis TaxID=359158 RepID=A0A6H9YMT5_9ACTN|nr:hypothetical protein [Actinomadura rudentiformis]KAB2347312.1 hypothetical protein F8566_20075 [Actinomadura rudentiformis]
MAAITRIEDWDGSGNLFVPGTDPAQILRDAQGAIDVDEIVLTRADEIAIEWFRVNPCHANNCYDGGHHNGHWTRTSGQTRGGFRGALLVTGYRDEVER